MDPPDDSDNEINSDIDDLPTEFERIEEEEVDLHPEIDFGREDDRARVWLLPQTRVLDLGGSFEKLFQNKVTVWSHIMENPEIEDPGSKRSLLSRLTRLLHELYSDSEDDYPRRGDLVYIEHELKLEPTNNLGKYFYDGSNVIIPDDLEGEFTVPRVFEVITEFPIQYWKDRLSGYYLIYFNFGQYFPSLSRKEVKLRNKIPSFRFYVEDHAFTIYSDVFTFTEANGRTIQDIEEFTEMLQTATLFTSQDGRLRFKRRNDFLTDVIKNADPDYTLYLSEAS